MLVNSQSNGSVQTRDRRAGGENGNRQSVVSVRQGGLSILVDHSARRVRNGILFAPARSIDAATVNEMARSGRSIIVCCVGAERVEELRLEPMSGAVHSAHRTRFLVSVEAAACESTGISAEDRAQTLRVLGDPVSSYTDLVTPGHIMPCLPSSERDEILLHRALQISEQQTGVAAVAWCDIVDERGNVASLDYCLATGRRLGIAPHDATKPFNMAEFQERKR